MRTNPAFVASFLVSICRLSGIGAAAGARRVGGGVKLAALKALVVLLVALAIIPSRAEAVVYNYQRTDADAVSYGVSLIDRGLAATEVFHNVGSFTNIQGSAVLLTDGTPAGTLNIAPVPAANGTKIEMGGYGFYARRSNPRSIHTTVNRAAEWDSGQRTLSHRGSVQTITSSARSTAAPPPPTR